MPDINLESTSTYGKIKGHFLVGFVPFWNIGPVWQALKPDLLQGHAPLAQFAVRRVRVVSGVQLGQIVQRQIAEIERVRRRLIDNHRQADYRRPARFQEPLRSEE